MTFEGGAGCILMLHNGREYEGADERHGQGVGHGLVVLVEGVFVHIESKAAIEVHEEDAAHVVALCDDDGILGAQFAQVGKGGAKHWVGAHIAHTCLLIELEETCLHA